jgi:Fis family transcriptional regulator, factor for inversion stimulation protein
VQEELEALIKRMIESGIQYREAIAEFEKRFIQSVLAKNKGNRSRAARELGIHRNTLSRKRGELGLIVTQSRGASEPISQRASGSRGVGLHKPSTRTLEG